MRKTLAAAGLLAVLAAGWWWAGMPGLSTATDGANGTPPRLRTAQADRGAITAVVAATGTVNPVTLVQVGSQLSGQIRELFADFNTRVAADQPIARLDTATIEARRAAAEADVHAAAAQVAVARAWPCSVRATIASRLMAMDSARRTRAS
uniref:efflux RND transporter periplasmic adaptor subunit n=1 Tax=Neoroseomonas rubea TaxID=2748666 RepID=UPI0018DFDF39